MKVIQLNATAKTEKTFLKNRNSLNLPKAEKIFIPQELFLTEKKFIINNLKQAIELATYNYKFFNLFLIY